MRIAYSYVALLRWRGFSILVHAMCIDLSVSFSFLLSTLTELAIEGNHFSVNAVRQFTNCLQYNTALRGFTLDPVPVSLDSDVNTGVLNALLEKNAELAQSRLALNELKKENSRLRMENAQLKETVKSLHGLY